MKGDQGMLEITVPGIEFFDDDTEEFITVGDTVIRLEHSLVSLSKWESLWEKPFLSEEAKTVEQTMSYIRLMLLTPNVATDVLVRLSEDNINDINGYINAKQSATFFNESIQPAHKKEIITSELIYYWMLTLNVPIECEEWHLNRLFTLIKVCSEKNAPQKKRGRREILDDHARINAQNRAKMGTTG